MIHKAKYMYIYIDYIYIRIYIYTVDCLGRRAFGLIFVINMYTIQKKKQMGLYLSSY